MIFVFVWLTSLHIISRSIYVITNGIISFLLWPSNIPLCIYKVFFIHSSVDGHLGCSHVLATVNSAVLNIGVCVSFWIRVFIFSEYIIYPGVGLMDHMLALFLVFLLFSIVAAPIYIPTNNLETYLVWQELLKFAFHSLIPVLISSY